MIRLILVDDHESSRWPLAFLLEQEPDMSVVAQADSLAEARQALKEIENASEGIDVAIVDLNLPDGEGTELIGELRAANPKALALVLTGYSEKERQARAVEAGAAGVLNKMAKTEEVVDAVRRLHSGEQLMTPAEVLEMARVAGRLREREREARDALGRLTPREVEVLRALAEGLGDKEISERLRVGERTVGSHMRHIFAKLGADSRVQALIFALRHGLVEVGRTPDDDEE